MVVFCCVLLDPSIPALASSYRLTYYSAATTTTTTTTTTTALTANHVSEFLTSHPESLCAVARSRADAITAPLVLAVPSLLSFSSQPLCLLAQCRCHVQQPRTLFLDAAFFPTPCHQRCQGCCTATTASLYHSFLAAARWQQTRRQSVPRPAAAALFCAGRWQHTERGRRKDAA